MKETRVVMPPTHNSPNSPTPGPTTRVGGPPPDSMPGAAPGAVVVLTVPRGAERLLGPALDALRDSEGPAGLRFARGALAVLVLAEDDEGLAPALRTAAARCPFPLRSGPFAASGAERLRLGARHARLLGMPASPVILLDARRAPAPGWLYGAVSALRDGARTVRARESVLALLGLGPAAPRAAWPTLPLPEPSGRALRAAVA